jgi:hypothetical protein
VIANKGEIRWLLENCIVPDLKAIRTENKFLTDVDEVTTPDYSVFEEDKEKVWGAIETCTIQCWVTRDGFAETVSPRMIGGDGNRNWSFDVRFIGGLRGGKGLRMRAVDLASDHKRAIDATPSRAKSGASVQLNVVLVEDYDFDRLSTESIGAWECTWRFDYTQPHHPNAE